MILTLGRGFTKISNSVFQSQILPKAVESGHLLHSLGEDVVEFSLKDKALLNKPIGFFKKHWETLMFQFRKWFSSWQNALTKEYGEFTDIKKEINEAGQTMIVAKNHMGTFSLSKSEKKEKYVVRYFKRDIQYNADQSVTVNPHDNLSWSQVPEQFREFIIRDAVDFVNKH